MVPANSCRIPRVPHYSGARMVDLNFHVRDYHALWCAFPHISANRWLPLYLVPRPRSSKPDRFRLVRFRSPLLTESLLFSFPPGTEMVHFPGFARARLWIHRAVVRFYRTGFPHSEIPGSKPACGSPRLIAACHVLHRLLLPRHPPCALSSLTIKFT